MTTRTTDYDAVIPTGWLTAYGRTFSDIPYAREVFEVLEVMRNQSDSAELLHKMKNTELAPKFEARYKLIDKLLRASGTKQILEVASGLSTRGVAMTADPSITYVEVDLPLMMADKRKIFGELQQRGTLPQRPNLHLLDGNAMNIDDLRRATSLFQPHEPIAVLTEGLLRYLTLDEQARYTAHVVDLLKAFGGIWITPDISLRRAPRGDGTTATRRTMITQVTGKDVSANRFRDLAHAVSFFEEKGLRVERRAFTEVAGELTSPQTLGLSTDDIAQRLGDAVVFVMRLA